MKKAIITQYKGPTGKTGSRIVASSLEGRKIIPYNHSLSLEDNHFEAALALSEKLNCVVPFYGLLAPSTKFRIWVTFPRPQ